MIHGAIAMMDDDAGKSLSEPDFADMLPMAAAALGALMTLNYPWELYDLRKDFSQSRNLAASNPAKLAEMKALFDQEAKRNGVYPLDDRTAFTRMNGFGGAMVRPRDHYVYYGKGIMLSHDVWPAIFNRGFTIDADIRQYRADWARRRMSWPSSLPP